MGVADFLQDFGKTSRKIFLAWFASKLVIHCLGCICIPHGSGRLRLATIGNCAEMRNISDWEIQQEAQWGLCVVLACLFTMGNIPSYFHVSVHCNTDHSLIQRKMQTINYSLFSSNKWFLSSVQQQVRVSVWQSVRYFFIFYWLRTEERHWDIETLLRASPVWAD